MLTIVAPAKINLTLEILGKRPDGYHEIRSIVQTVNLNDKLHFKPGDRIEFECDVPGWDYEKSLVSKTVSLLRGNARKGAAVEIEKKIPLVAGLGGDSSDAAAVLRGLNILWELRLSLRELANLALQLGSDVPLFIHGGTVLMEGRGGKLTPLPPMPHMTAVIFVPPMPGLERKTEQLYSRVKPADYTAGHLTDDFVQWLNKREKSTSPVLFNVFDYIAPGVFPGLKEYRQRFLEAGAPEVHMAGSGPALYTLTQDAAVAGRICSSLGAQGLESYQADF